jgi:hypothetical protein
MIRWLGLSFVVISFFGWPSLAKAQSAADPYGFLATDPGAFLDSLEPFGAFGFETMQTPFSGSVVMDRFGMVHGTVYARPAASPPQPPRSRAKTGRTAASGRITRARHPLPTGSLNWPGANGVVLYSPAYRYQNYGGGYGRGPYGSIDCGMMFKGMALGY